MAGNGPYFSWQVTDKDLLGPGRRVLGPEGELLDPALVGARVAQAAQHYHDKTGFTAREVLCHPAEAAAPVPPGIALRASGLCRPGTYYIEYEVPAREIIRPN